MPSIASTRSSRAWYASGVLHDQLRLTVDGQNKEMPRLLEAVQEVDGIALEVAERTDVVSKTEHARPSLNLHRI
jgi:hypothetical protein